MNKCILLTIFFANIFNWMSGHMNEMSKEDIATSVVINKTAKKLNAKYGLQVGGTGGSCDDNEKTTMIYLGFHLYHPISMEKCRKLILECAHQFLHEINNDHNLQPYLAERPFPVKNIELDIFISNPDNSDLVHPNISVVTLIKGIITYRTNDPENQYRYKARIKETYEEALQKVMSGS